MKNNSLRALLFILMFLSGLCSLMYQIVWTRMMTLVFGITVYAVSAVLCSFMLGLALGNFAMARWVERIRRPIAIFGWMEIGIGVFAVIFPLMLHAATPLFVRLHRQFFEESYTLFSLMRFGLILPILLIPTGLMGANLPLISHFFIHGRREMGRDLGTLYAVNTTGAVIGAFLVGFVFLERFGMNGTIWLSAAVNTLLGTTALIAGRGVVIDPAASPAGEAAQPPPPPRPQAHRRGQARKGTSSKGVALRTVRAETAAPGTMLILMAAAFLTGFASLALEVLWTRAIIVEVNNSTYAFSAILITFLSGLAIGSWLVSLLVSRVRRTVSLLAFIEIMIGLWIFCSFFLLAWLPAFAQMIQGIIPTNRWSAIILLILSKAALIFLVPTILMGMGLPLIVHLVGASGQAAGRAIGHVFGVNTIGTVLGAFFAGFVFIPAFGVRTSILIIMGIYLACGVAILAAEKSVASGPRYLGYGIAGALLLLSPAIIPGDFFKRDFARRFGSIVYYEEDITDTVFVVDPLNSDGSPNKSMRDVVFADGRANGGHRTRLEDRYYAHLPLFLHPEPKDVLAIGVCSGNTAGAASLHKRMRNFVNVELSQGVVNAVAHIETNYGVFHTRKDPRVKLVIEDGRNYLLGTPERFDVININPPYVNTAGVVFLYTENFLQLCLDRLKPGGLVSHFIEPDKLTEADLKKLIATWTEVFPHFALFNGPRYYSWNLVGSAEPITIPLDKIRRTLAAEPDLREKLEEDGLDDPVRFFASMLMNEGKMREFAKGAVTLTDDMTRIDFSSPRSQFAGFGVFLTTRGLYKPSLSQEEFTQWMKGGWAALSRAVNDAEYASNHVDWTGISEEQKQADIQAFIEARQNRIAAYNRDFGISLNISH